MTQRPRAFAEHDATVFLAMFWAGGGPFMLWQVVAAYDWVNRCILSSREMSGALNRLLAAGLIERKSRAFVIPPAIYRRFDAFRKRRRKGRFETADAFLKNYEPLVGVPRRVRLTESSYRRALDQYRKAFQEAYHA